MSTSTDWLESERQDLAVQRILEAAANVVARDGLRRIRMAKVAEAARCSRATLYRYFANKERLLEAYVEHVSRQFDDVLRERLSGLRSLGPRFVEAAATSIELIASREDLAPFFSEEGVGLTAQLAANAAGLRERLAKQLDRESCSPDIEGRLRSDVTPEAAAEWLTRAILSFTVMRAPERDSEALRAYLSLMLVPALVET
jgi:AcrR family transcriptional regulator